MSYNFSTIENIMISLVEDSSSYKLNLLKNELNKFFNKSKCKEIVYTNNTDKLFFGMRTYISITGKESVDILTDPKSYGKPFSAYVIEFDSKLFDPILGLTAREYTAILLHEIGHIVYDTSSIDKVKLELDNYMINSDNYLSTKNDPAYNELLAYALKDAVFKVGSLFSKIGNEEILADSMVAAWGYGPDLELAFRKICRSSMYLNKNVNNKLVVLAWVMRLSTNIGIERLAAIKTLNKAKQLTGSSLEKREIEWAVRNLNKALTEGVIDNIKTRLDKKFYEFKSKGIRLIKNDIYELNLRLRAAESEEDLIYVIRTANSDIIILQDYLTEPDISDAEMQSVNDALHELYEIRTKAAKNKEIRDRCSSMITVVYPNLD